MSAHRLFCAAAAWLLTTAISRADLADSLSPSQLQQLNQGQMVVESKDIPGGVWPQLTVYTVVNAPVATVAGVFRDYKHAQDFQPDMVSAKVVSQPSPNVCDVQYTQKMPIFGTTSFTVQNTYSESNGGVTVKWKLLKSAMADISDGSLRVEPYNNGSILRYVNYVKPKGGFIAGVAKNAALDSVKNTVAALKTEARNARRRSSRARMSALEQTVVGSTLIARPTGRLDAHTSAELQQEISPRFGAEAQHLVLNLQDVSYLSSASLRVFLQFTVRRAPGRAIRARRHPALLPRSHPYFRTRRHPAIYEYAAEALAAFEPGQDVRALPLGEFHFSPGADGPGAIEILGHIDDVLESRVTEGMLEAKTFSSKGYSIGLGGMGASDAEVMPLLGEMMTIGGTMVWLPTDGADTPDFLIPKADSEVVKIRTAFTPRSPEPSTNTRTSAPRRPRARASPSSTARSSTSLGSGEPTFTAPSASPCAPTWAPSSAAASRNPPSPQTRPLMPSASPIPKTSRSGSNSTPRRATSTSPALFAASASICAPTSPPSTKRASRPRSIAIPRTSPRSTACCITTASFSARFPSPTRRAI